MSGDEKKILIALVSVLLILICFGIAVGKKISVNDDYYDRDYHYPDYDHMYPTDDSIEEPKVVIEEPDWLKVEDHIIEIPYNDTKPSTSDFGLDINDNGLFEFLVVEMNFEVNFNDEYQIQGKLCFNIDNRSCEFSYLHYLDVLEVFRNLDISKGKHRIAYLFPAYKINSEEVNGPYTVKFCIGYVEYYSSCISYGLNSKLNTYTTNYYSYEEFEKPRYNFQSFKVVDDYGIDYDNDGYYDSLMVIINTTVLESGSYYVSSYLIDECIGFRYYNWLDVNLKSGRNLLEIGFSGEQIYMMGLNGPYIINLIIHHADGSQRKPTPANYYLYAYDEGREEVEYVSRLYSYEDFDHVILPVHWIGNEIDYGLDTDGNGLYDFLRVSFDVQVDIGDNYRITAHVYSFQLDGRCKDKVFIEWTQNIKFLDAGAQNIEMDINTRSIRTKGIDGPYVIQVRILPVSNSNDPIFVFETNEYSVQEFD